MANMSKTEIIVKILQVVNDSSGSGGGSDVGATEKRIIECFSFMFNQKRRYSFG